MSSTKTLKNPFVLVPLLAGILLPCVVFLILHLSHLTAAKSQNFLKDAVVISGQPLPKLELVDLEGGKVSPEELRTGKVLLVFLTTNCQACQKELKLLSRVESQLSDKVKIYGVGIQSRNQIIKFIQEHDIKTEILLDKDAALLQSLSVKYFPTKFLVEDGVIVNTWFGNSPDEAELFRQLGL
jgi:peroxiredoxin